MGRMTMPLARFRRPLAVTLCVLVGFGCFGPGGGSVGRSARSPLPAPSAPSPPPSAPSPPWSAAVMTADGRPGAADPGTGPTAGTSARRLESLTATQLRALQVPTIPDAPLGAPPEARALARSLAERRIRAARVRAEAAAKAKAAAKAQEQARAAAAKAAAARGAPNCAVAKCIALTFDDGPGPDTQRLLKTLAAKKVRASFFLLGRNVAARPGVVTAIARGGHALGNHTWDHKNLTTLPEPELAAQFSRTAGAVRNATGANPTMVRPPYGALNDGVRAWLARSRTPVIMWNVDTLDWKTRSALITTQRALDGARPGAIILMHDIHASTVDAVPGIIDGLRARGYTLVTVPQLFGGAAPAGVHFAR